MKPPETAFSFAQYNLLTRFAIRVSIFFLVIGWAMATARAGAITDTREGDSSAIDDANSISPTQSHGEQIQSKHWRGLKNCGVNCAYVLLRLEHRKVSLNRVKELIPVHETGTNLSEMCEGIRQLGGAAQVVRVKGGEIRDDDLPAIAHCVPGGSAQGLAGHYVVVLAVKDRNVYILDPVICAPQSIPRADFMHAWTGALIIGKNPSPSASRELSVLLAIQLGVIGYVLLIRRSARPGSRQFISVLVLILGVFSGCGSPVTSTASNDHREGRRARRSAGDVLAYETVKDVGIIDHQNKADAVFTILNSGDHALELAIGKPSCACTAIEVGARVVAPGDSTDIRMVLNAQDRAGPISASVIVADNAGNWAESFQARGVALGARMNAKEFNRKSSKTDEWRVSIDGVAYCRVGPPSCSLRLLSNEDTGPSLLLEPEINSSATLMKTTDGYSAYTVRMEIHFTSNEQAEFVASRMCALVTVAADSWKYADSLKIVCDGVLTTDSGLKSESTNVVSMH